jgi:hypothetical protein
VHHDQHAPDRPVGLALVIAAGVGASFFAKRNEEMQSGGHH